MLERAEEMAGCLRECTVWGSRELPPPPVGVRVGEQGLPVPTHWGGGRVTPGCWDGAQLNTLFLL